MMKFHVSNMLDLPRDAVTWVISIVAKRGAGKSYSGGVIAEEMLKNDVPVIVLDVMGTWWGLRVGRNGKGDGLPIVVFGGEHADIPLDPAKSTQMAKAIVETNISAVIDLSNLSKAMSRRVVSEFLDELYKINRLERHVFIEEADMFAPQRVFDVGQTQCLGSMDNFVRRGGNHNLGCTLITQRSAVLNKDLLTQSDCLMILRTLAPQDKKAIQAWVEEQTDKEKKSLNEWYDTLKSLKNGECWCWHPENPSIFKKIMFRERETFHATRTFLLTSKASSIKLMDVEEFVARFKDKFEPKPVVKEVAKVLPPTKVQQPVVQRSVAVDVHTRPEPYWYDETLEPPKEVVIRKSEPTIILEKLKPTITVLSEPMTPLGKLIIILKAMLGNRNNAWSANSIKKKIEEHAWSADGIEHEIERLRQWEILTWQSNGLMRFHPDRVKIIDREVDYDETQ